MSSLIQTHLHHAGLSEGTAGQNTQQQKPCNYQPVGMVQLLPRDCLGRARMARPGSQRGWHGGSCSADQVWTSWAGWQARQGLSPGDCCGDAADAETSNWLQVRTRSDPPSMLLIALHVSSNPPLSSAHVNTHTNEGKAQKPNISLAHEIKECKELAERQHSLLHPLLFSTQLQVRHFCNSIKTTSVTKQYRTQEAGQQKSEPGSV